MKQGVMKGMCFAYIQRELLAFHLKILENVSSSGIGTGIAACIQSQGKYSEGIEVADL